MGNKSTSIEKRYSDLDNVYESAYEFSFPLPKNSDPVKFLKLVEEVFDIDGFTCSINGPIYVDMGNATGYELTIMKDFGSIKAALGLRQSIELLTIIDYKTSTVSFILKLIPKDRLVAGILGFVTIIPWVTLLVGISKQAKMINNLKHMIRKYILESYEFKANTDDIILADLEDVDVDDYSSSEVDLGEPELIDPDDIILADLEDVDVDDYSSSEVDLGEPEPCDANGVPISFSKKNR